MVSPKLICPVSLSLSSLAVPVMHCALTADGGGGSGSSGRSDRGEMVDPAWRGGGHPWGKRECPGRHVVGVNPVDRGRQRHPHGPFRRTRCLTDSCCPRRLSVLKSFPCVPRLGRHPCHRQVYLAVARVCHPHGRRCRTRYLEGTSFPAGFQGVEVLVCQSRYALVSRFIGVYSLSSLEVCPRASHKVVPLDHMPSGPNRWVRNHKDGTESTRGTRHIGVHLVAVQRRVVPESV